MWDVEFTNEFERWWKTLNEAAQIDISTSVGLLEEYGPYLKFPYSSGIQRSKYQHLRELRIQHKGKPLRVLYAFDPRRIVILLIGGEKTGQNDWYEKHVPIADKLYKEHLESLEKEGLIYE